MNDRLSAWPDTDRYAGEAAIPEPRPFAGEMRGQNAHPVPSRTAPAPARSLPDACPSALCAPESHLTEPYSLDPQVPEPYPLGEAPGREGVAPAFGTRPTPQGAARGSGGGSTRLGRRSPGARRSPGRRIARMLLLLLLVLLLTPVGTYVWADSVLNREVDLVEVGHRPPKGRGTNYLIVGSDSREGLSEQDRKKLRTGTFEGGRTDSMILLHTGANGTTMMSLPRDSWVTIPEFLRPETGKSYPAAGDKLNAAYSLGGPDLLIRTIEHNTGLHIDHYAEIGLGGFVGIVDAIGGVEMCVDRDIRDEKSGLDVKRGCQIFDGTRALAFVRQRRQEVQGDLGRTRNQQRFLAALADRAARPDIAFNPSRLFPAASAGLDTLAVDEDTGVRELASLFQALRDVTAGGGRQLNVPVSVLDFRTSKGTAVLWDTARANQLFAELRNDLPVTSGEQD